MSRLSACLLGAALLAACERTSAPEPAPGTPPASGTAPTAQVRDLGEQMRAHADRAEAARQALIEGDLDAARQALRSLAEHAEPASVPAAWRAQVGALEAAARAAADAPDLRACAMGVARLSESCATCHATLDRGPGVPIDAPPGGDALGEHMRRHAWALERMWQGLVAASPVMYRRGALALVEAPIHGEATPDREFPAEVTGLAARVHDLGLGAHDAAEPAEQARLYGELLGACGTCHHAVEAF